MIIRLYESHYSVLSKSLTIYCDSYIITSHLIQYALDSFMNKSHWCGSIHEYDTNEIAYEVFLSLHKKESPCSSVIFTVNLDEGDVINNMTILKLNKKSLTLLDLNGDIETMPLEQFLYDNIINAPAVQKT